MNQLSPISFRQKALQKPDGVRKNNNCSFEGRTAKSIYHNDKLIKKVNSKYHVSFGSGQIQPNQLEETGLPQFHIPVPLVKNLLNSIDGMVPYGPDAPADLQGFPQGNSYHYAPGFKADLTLNGPTTFNKSPAKGGINYQEKILATNELHYCASEMYPPGTAENNAALNAGNLLFSLFQGPIYGPEEGKLRAEFDVNCNGIFDAQDVETLSKLDGDPQSLSTNDFRAASTFTTGRMVNLPPQYYYTRPQ